MSKPADLLNKAFELHKSGRVTEAVGLYNQVLQRVLFLLGTASQETGQLELAVRYLRESLVLNPDNVAAHNNLGNTLRLLDHCDEAVASFDNALMLDPQYAEGWYNRGNALRYMQRLDEALASYGKAVDLQPDLAKAYNNRGVTLRELDRFDEAMADYDKAIDLQPEYAAAHNNRGALLKHLNRLDEALESYDQALLYKPDYAEAYSNRGVVLKKLRRLDEALASYDKALALEPDYPEASWNKADLLMLRGRVLESWGLFEWRTKRKDVKASYYQFAQLAWRGQQDIRGRKLLIHCEQGFGDVIQFCRYVPQVRALGAEIVFEVQKPLLPFIATLDCDVTLVEKGRSLPEFDAYCPVMSLPLVFQTTLESIPAQIPYLHSDAGRLAHWRQQVGRKRRLRVGLAWYGSVGNNNDHNRSIALQDLLPLLDVPVEWHSLHMECRQQDTEVLAQHPGIHQHHAGRNDFADTAALIDCMDLVITVDTSFAHVAGALGKPVWILLPFVPDCRWMLDRDDSPWYPTARLFRQPRLGDWGSVIDTVASALEANRACADRGG